MADKGKVAIKGKVSDVRFASHLLPRIDCLAGGLETLIIMGIAVAQGQGGNGDADPNGGQGQEGDQGR